MLDDNPQLWGIWMISLWPNGADARWYPPHAPTHDTGTKEWAEETARQLNANRDFTPAWVYEPQPYDPNARAFPPAVSPESGAPWTAAEMAVHRRVARDYPVEELVRPLPGDHVRRWVATVDALESEAARMRVALKMIDEWSKLRPPNSAQEQSADAKWLRRVVDDGLGRGSQ